MNGSTNRRYDKRGVGKFGVVVGIGGIHCPCCTLGKPKESRILWNRLDRRRSRRELAKEIRNESV